MRRQRIFWAVMAVLLLGVAGLACYRYYYEMNNDLYAACEYGSPQQAEKALHYGARVNAWSGVANEPPLSAAVRARKLSTVNVLLAHGADPTVRGADGLTPFTWAAIESTPEIYARLLTATEQRRDWSDALFSAVIGDNMPMAVYCRRHGGDVNTRWNEGATPLHSANSTAMTAWLMEQGARVNARTEDGTTPLMRMVSDAPVGAVAYLLAHGAEVQARDHAGRTALHYLANTGNCDEMTDRLPVLKLLLAKGAVVNARADDGSTPLHEAARQYRTATPATAQVLLAHEADPTARDRRGRTPADIARLEHHPAIAKLLTDAARNRGKMAPAKTNLKEGER